MQIKSNHFACALSFVVPMSAANDQNGGGFDRTPMTPKVPSGRTTAVFLAMLLSCASATAGQFSSPTFVVSSINDTDSFSVPAAQVADKVVFSGTARQSTGITQIPEAGTFFTEDSKTVQGGFTDISTVNTYNMEGTPSAVEAKVLNHASTTGGEGAFVNTGVFAEQWYVLQGPGSGTVSLRADVAFQGQLSGSGLASPRAFFNGTVYLVSQPGATSLTVPLALDSHLIAPGDPTVFSDAHTVPGVVSTSDITINEVIRSNPFQVEIGVPFGIIFSLAAAATTDVGGGAATTADSNFFDPNLATSSLFPTLPQLTPDGFGIDATGGNVQTLSSAGLTLQPIVPEPATLTLLSLGLVGLGFARWRRQMLMLRG